MASWEALEAQQEFLPEDIAVENLFEDWERYAAGDDGVQGTMELLCKTLVPWSKAVTMWSEGGVAALACRSLPAKPDVKSTQTWCTVLVQTYPESPPLTAHRELLGETYMESLNVQSGLHIVVEQQVTRAYKDNEAPAKSEIDASCGLEIAMSICVLSDISEYWSEKRFFGQTAFPEKMAGTGFQQIRGALKFHAESDTSVDKIRDPLWHSRTMLNHFRSALQLLLLQLE
ncbi:hypothetical protein PPTG_19775 [Phytophthora nicotianae INRA-310]|uniref:PiggyBac transposable element-derived protein domain-containing protein n=1 Tax=Phytophthora nicotianae (strain INRA-310) TaxID=761204 RepID=W2PD62_PHYN3|nr:hypothetical protein PPTG_19775 [Phytophthora nicotianae INRA-310]ETM98153.1 hypothetical protein PPTG_19775 [Phytophthora nicotianae INRA-310]